MKKLKFENGSIIECPDEIIDAIRSEGVFIWNGSEVKCDLSPPVVRAFPLSNEDIITVHNEGEVMLLEYEDRYLYEVEERSFWGNSIYERTGVVFTPEEINKMLEEKESE